MASRLESSVSRASDAVRWQNVVVLLTAGCAAALGLLVMVGWHTHTTGLLQVRSGYIAMVYNSALCFVLSGVALWALKWRAPWATVACGGLVATAGFLSAIQYLFGVDFGIDQLLMEHYLTVETSHPGRMAPNTAFCFALIGAALVVLRCGRWRGLPMVAGVLSCVCTAVAVNAFVGYLTGIRIAYGWGPLIPMAVHTALGMVLVGMGVIAHAWREGTPPGGLAPRWFPLLVGVGVLTVAVGQWQALIVKDHASMERTVARQARQGEREFTTLLGNQIAPLVRMARRLERRPDVSRHEWEADAGQNLTYYPNYQAIGWVDAAAHLRWITPEEGRASFSNPELALQEHLRVALEASRQEHSPMLSRWITLAKGERGFLVFVPLVSAERFEGWIAGVLPLRKLFDALLLESFSLEDYAVAIADDAEEIYSSSAALAESDHDWGEELVVNVYGARWRVNVWPKAEFLAEERSVLPQVVLSSGVLTACLLALAVALAQAGRWSSTRFRDLYNNAPCAYHALDAQSTVVAINDTELRWLQYAREEVVGKMNLAELLTPASLKGFQEHFAKLTEEDSIRELEVELVRKDGTCLPVLLNATRIKDAQGRTVTSRATLFDITDRKRAESALRESEERLARIVETIADAIFIVDRSGRITFANATAEQMFGLSRHHITSRVHNDPLWKITRPDGKPFPDDELPFTRVMRTGVPVYGSEVGVERADGQRLVVSVNAAPLCDADGTVAGMVSSVSDVTRRKEIERLKDEFVSTVSHELRTPLSSLRGFAELMLTRDFSAEKRREFLTIIHSEAVRLTTLINDFLDIQRMESGRERYAFAVVDLAELARANLALFSPEEAHHYLHLEIAEDLPPVWADADRVRQVLSNLISNAIKFSPRGGKVTVGARREVEHVVAWVADEGMGIPPDVLPKLFTKFFRADNEETRTIGGTGLGLALVKEIVQAHSGNVWVESEPGSGSTFFFTLPAAQLLPSVAKPAREELQGSSDILLVEDDPAFAKLLGEHFALEGLSVATATTAEGALELVRRSPPRLALVDVHLAGPMDGWDLLVAIKGDPVLRSIAVLIISASDTINARGLAVSGGDYVLKPISPSWLLEAVRTHLASQTGKQVLVVDDDQVFRNQVRECLAPEGIEVEVAASGREALERMAARMPDLLLLDLLMPGVDGFEVLNRLRTDKRAVNLPVLVITGQDLKAEDKAYIKRRMATLVRKRETSLEHIAEAVEQILAVKLEQ